MRKQLQRLTADITRTTWSGH